MLRPKIISPTTSASPTPLSIPVAVEKFLPLLADALLESLALLRDAAGALRTRCIETLEADAGGCARHLAASTAPANSGL